MITNMLLYQYNIEGVICIKLFFIKIINGRNEVKEYIETLRKENNKDSKIKMNKIIAYMRRLKERGLSLGENYIKHIDKQIWELRPLKDRILFAYIENNEFIILSYFTKQTQKTPKREIQKAKKYLEDYKRRKKICMIKN